MSKQPSRRQDKDREMRLSTATLLVALVAVPVYFNIQTTTSFEPDKGILIICLAVLALFASIHTLVREGLEQLRRPGIPWLLLAGFGAVVILSSIWSADPVTSFWGSHERGLGLLVVVAGAILTFTAYKAVQQGWLWLLIDSFLIGSIIPAIYGIVQVLGVDPVRGVTVSFTLGERASSTLGNPLFLADYLLIVFLLALGRVLRGPRSGARAHYALVGTLIVLAAALVLTFSRSALIGGIVALVFLFIAWGKEKDLKAMRLAGFGVLGLGFGLLLAAWLVPHLLPVRLGDLFASGGTGGQRMLIWEGVLAMLWQQPATLVLGRGLDVLPYPLTPYAPAQLAHFEIDWVYRIPDRAHTLTLDLLAQTGILGLLAWTSFMGILVNAVVPTHQGWRRTRPAFLSVGGAILGAMTAGILAGITASPLGWSAGFVGGAFLALLLAPENTEQEDGARTLRPFLLAALVGHWMLLAFSFTTQTSEMLFWVMAGIILAQWHAPGYRAAAPDPGSRHPYQLQLAGITLAVFGFSLSGSQLRGVPLALLALVVLFILAFAITPHARTRERLWFQYFLPLLTALPILFLSTRTGLPAWLAYAGFLVWLPGMILWLMAPALRRGSLGVVAISLPVWVLISLPIWGDIAYQTALLAPVGSDDRHDWMTRAIRFSPYDHVLLTGLIPGEARSLPASAGLDDPQAQRIMSLYEDAISAQPLAMEPIAQYANWLRQRGMADDRANELAAQRYEQTLELAPKNIQAYHENAQLLWQRGVVDQARDELEALLVLDPLYGPPYLTLAAIHQHQGDTDQALRVLESGMEQLPWWASLPDAAEAIRQGESLWPVLREP